MDYGHLKSGSDIRGTALDLLGGAVTLTPEAAADITRAFFYYMNCKQFVKRAAVGCDPRLSGAALKSAVIEALTKSGADVFDIGLSTTPSAFMMTKFPEVDADVAVMITASHHPKDKNGLKFFSREGGLSGKDIDNILSLALYGVAHKPSKEGVVHTGQYFDLYAAHLIKTVQDALGKQPLTGMKIVVDAGNGAGGFYADKVLKPLGADVSGSLFLEPDGNFPNHAPNPENAEAMRFISEGVLRAGADLGIIFDTDVDRAAVVDETGCEINRDRLIALVSKILLKEHPGATIVTDSVTSLHLTEFIRKAGGAHLRYKRGYRNVIDEAARLTANGIYAPLAIETSGHAALEENYFLDDGAYLVTRILIEAARLKRKGLTVASLLEGFTDPLEACELRLSLPADDYVALGKAVIDGLSAIRSAHAAVASDSREGVRLLLPPLKGFLMVRQSVHDPVLVVNAQCDEAGGVKKALGLLHAFLQAFPEIDLAPLTERI